MWYSHYNNDIKKIGETDIFKDKLVFKMRNFVFLLESRMIFGLHYANTPMQYIAIFHAYKNVHFQMNFFNIFLIFAQNIDCGYTLEPPHYNLCFGTKIRKKVYPCKPQFYYIKLGCKGVLVTRTCFRDVSRKVSV